VQATDQPAWARFTKASGEERTIRLRPDIPALVKKYVDEKGVEQAGDILMQMAVDQVFLFETKEDNKN
jgi:hypothetical protein